MELLRVEHLSKIYGAGENQVKALDDVSLSVEKGEFVAIVGASGSGKSTLLHLLGGVDRPTSGKVYINGTDIFAMNDDELAIFRRRQVGIIYQFYNLIPILNVEENMAIPMELDGRKVEKAQMDDSLLTLNLTVIKGQPLPEIWVFNNEVLFVSHIQGDYLDIRYADYRWYRDGVLVHQDTAADRYFNPDGAALSGCYYLEVPTSEAKTEWVRSNTICIGSVGIDDVSADDLRLTLYPNPVAAHSVVHVSLSLAETQLQGAKIKVFDVQGRQVLERAAHQQTDFVCDFVAGVYSVHVLLSGCRHAARKLVVR